MDGEIGLFDSSCVKADSLRLLAILTGWLCPVTLCLVRLEGAGRLGEPLTLMRRRLHA